VIRYQSKNGIVLPKYIGELFMYFKNEVRPILIANDDILAFWLNRKGNPLCK
jgi:hypothetical protein